MNNNTNRYKNYTMIRVKRTVNEVAKRKAATQNRSISNYVQNLIENDPTELAEIEQQGGGDDGSQEE